MSLASRNNKLAEWCRSVGRDRCSTNSTAGENARDSRCLGLVLRAPQKGLLRERMIQLLFAVSHDFIILRPTGLASPLRSKGIKSTPRSKTNPWPYPQGQKHHSYARTHARPRTRPRRNSATALDGEAGNSRTLFQPSLGSPKACYRGLG